MYEYEAHSKFLNYELTFIFFKCILATAMINKFHFCFTNELAEPRKINILLQINHEIKKKSHV